MNNRIKHTAEIDASLAGKRLDQALAILFTDYSRTRLTQWLREGKVTLDGEVCQTPREKVKENQQVRLEAEMTQETNWEAQSIPLDIIYEDEAIIVINKPEKLIVHPGNGNPDKTLVNALLHHAPELAQLPRAGIIHRIDKDTTGLLVIARTLATHTTLVQQIQAHEVSREYEAVVHGNFIAGGTVNAPIGRHPTNRIKMAVTPSGKPAITHYRVQERFPDHTLLSLQLETGRTHQIRVHMSYMHHPIVGDQTYSNRINLPKDTDPRLINYLKSFKRQALHAKQLTFRHPLTQETVTYSAPRPKDLETLVTLLRSTTTS